MQTRGARLSVAARDRALLVAEVRARLWAALDHAERIGLQRSRSGVSTDDLGVFLAAHGATLNSARSGQIAVSPGYPVLKVAVIDPVWRALNRDSEAQPEYLYFEGDPAEMTLTQDGGYSIEEHGIGVCHEGYFFALDDPDGDGWTVAWFGDAYAGPACKMNGTLLVPEYLSRPEFGADGYPAGDWIDNDTGEPIRLDEIDRSLLDPHADLYDGETAERIGPATPAQWWAGSEATRSQGREKEPGLFLIDQDGEPITGSWARENGRKVFVL